MLGINACVLKFLFIVSLKFLFIYECFFKTDADKFTLHSLDVAAADHSC